MDTKTIRRLAQRAATLMAGPTGPDVTDELHAIADALEEAHNAPTIARRVLAAIYTWRDA